MLLWSGWRCTGRPGANSICAIKRFHLFYPLAFSPWMPPCGHCGVRHYFIHCTAAYFGPRPYIVLVLSLVFAEYLPTPWCRPFKTWRSDGHSQHERARIFLTEYTFSALGNTSMPSYCAQLRHFSYRLEADTNVSKLAKQRHNMEPPWRSIWVIGRPIWRVGGSLLSTPFVWPWPWLDGQLSKRSWERLNFYVFTVYCSTLQWKDVSKVWGLPYGGIIEFEKVFCVSHWKKLNV